MNKDEYKKQFAFNLKALSITFNTLVDNSNDEGIVDLTTFAPPFDEQCFHQAILALSNHAEDCELGYCVEIIDYDTEHCEFYDCPLFLIVKVHNPEIYTGLEL